MSNIPIDREVLSKWLEAGYVEDGILYPSHNTEAILVDNPRSGRTVPEIGNSDIRELIYRGYRIVYRLNGDRIEILTVFEEHRLLRLNESGD